MNLKKSLYFKTFESEVAYEKVKKEVTEMFAFRNNFGFDGRMRYSFDFGGGFVSDQESDKCLKYSEKCSYDKEENAKYKTIVKIKKTGNIKDYSKLCDLEKFLLERGFQSK